jgi:nitroimidazol reductase NimA-like FMN-containing flavoprotein (pyridoxamine 5'-phosphate oxidase superfamily)
LHGKHKTFVSSWHGFDHWQYRIPASERVMPHKPARHRVQRSKSRARYDRESVHAILDAGLIAHVGFCVDAQPFVIPMLYARTGDALLLHGSVASRLLREIGSGARACVEVTLLDGLVLARSHFHHSANYRSVVAFGTAHAILDPAEKADTLARFVDALVPGRAAESRPANRKELAATAALWFTIEDASAKVRAGGVKDEASDLGSPHWAGVVPIREVFDTPQPAPEMEPGRAWPTSVDLLLARRRAST